MDRLIIESIEGRITLGITMFVALMILIGWIMINEPYRMAEFEEQHLGRSIEQGAELYASSCTSCHGVNGQGIIGRAPALNNPHLFEYDFTTAVNGEIADKQREIRDFYLLQSDLTQRKQVVTEELGAEDISEERAEELSFEIILIDAQLNDNLEAVEAQLAELEAAEGAAEGLTEEQTEQLLAALQNNISMGISENLEALDGEEGLIAQRDAVLSQLEAAIARGYYPELEAYQANVADKPSDANDITGQLAWINSELELTSYIASDSSRLLQIGWGGDLRGYLTTTLIHGRPGSMQVYPGSEGGMVSWSQEGGGPLRRDQIDNIVNYILNWDKGDDWSMGDLATVQQFALLHTAATGETASSEPTEITKPDEAELGEVLALTGDAANGELRYTALGCSGCHGVGTGPATEGTWSRIVNDRLGEPVFEGWTPEEYIYFSITHPGDYLVEGYQNLMPAAISATMTPQDYADIIAFLESQG